MHADDLHCKEGVERCVEQDMTLLVSFVNDPRRFGVVVTNEDGTIKILKKNTSTRNQTSLCLAYMCCLQKFLNTKRSIQKMESII